MQISIEARNKSSGLQIFLCPPNSGGQATLISGFPSDFKIPFFSPIHFILVSYSYFIGSPLIVTPHLIFLSIHQESSEFFPLNFLINYPHIQF